MGILAIQMGLGQERGETQRLLNQYLQNPTPALKTQMEDVKRRMTAKKLRLREQFGMDDSELERLIQQAFPRRRLARVRAGNILAIQMGLGQERGETQRLLNQYLQNPTPAL